MDEFALKIGTRIKELRQDKEMSQEELAFTASLNRTFIGELERGKKNATVATIDKICRALDVSLCAFFSFDSEDFDQQADTLIKVSSLLKQFDNKQLPIVLDIIKKTIELNNTSD